MAAPMLKIYVTTASRLPSLNVRDGQLIFVKDTRKIYLDHSGVRVEYSSITVLTSEQDRLGLLAPVEGFYYVEQTGVMWRYKNEWTQINSSADPIYIGGFDTFPAEGESDKIYVADDAIYRWDSANKTYLLVANQTGWGEIPSA